VFCENGKSELSKAKRRRVKGAKDQNRNSVAKTAFPPSFLVLETPNAKPERALIVTLGEHLRGQHVQKAAVGRIRRRSPVETAHALTVVRGIRVAAATGEAELEGRDDRGVVLP